MKHFIFLLALLLLLLTSCKHEPHYYSIVTTAQPEEGGSVAITPSDNPVLEGTSVTFMAQPNKDYVFTGWSGDLTGIETPITVSVSSDKAVKAHFGFLPNLMQPWYKLKSSQFGFSSPLRPYSSYRYLLVDYNRDGLLDFILADYDGQGSMERKYPIRFYRGLFDGSLIPDKQNDAKIQGMIHIRKMMYGDYNADGYPDICLLGHGYDTDPWGGEYPVILMSSPSGEYKDIRYTDYVSYYHGGSQGDFDNDGDLDLFILGNFGHSAILVNDGRGNFTVDESKVHPRLFQSLFNTEFYDFDHDGFLDLICGGHDWEDQSYYQEGDVSYSNTPIVFWGNGETFNTDDYVRLPQTNNEGYGLACDYYFKDLNNDGVDEIIMARTGDGVRKGGPAFYAGWSIQVLECKGRQFKDVSSQYFEREDDSYNIDRQYHGWIAWLDMLEIDGKDYLIGCFDCPEYPSPVKLFEFTNGVFIRVP